MEILRVGFVGTRTPNTESTVAFFRDVLGLPVLRDDPDWSILQLPTGPFDFLEVYKPDFDDERLIPSGVDWTVSFVVGDLEEAHREVSEAGITVSDPIWARDAFADPTLEGFGWFFLEAPDGSTYVIQQTPA